MNGSGISGCGESISRARRWPSKIESTIIRGAEADFGPDVVVFQAGTSRGEDGALVDVHPLTPHETTA